MNHENFFARCLPMMTLLFVAAGCSGGAPESETDEGALSESTNAAEVAAFRGASEGLCAALPGPKSTCRDNRDAHLRVLLHAFGENGSPTTQPLRLPPRCSAQGPDTTALQGCVARETDAIVSTARSPGMSRQALEQALRDVLQSGDALCMTSSKSDECRLYVAAGAYAAIEDDPHLAAERCRALEHQVGTELDCPASPTEEEAPPV